METYVFSYGDLAHLPLSLTRLDFMITRWRRETVNAKDALGCSLDRMANLQQLRVRGHRLDWEELLAPLARISGLSDLELTSYCRDTLCSFSGFDQLTRLSVSFDLTDEVFAGLGPVSDLSGLKELRLVGPTYCPRNPSLACLSSLSLLTGLTLMGFLAGDLSSLTSTLLGGLQSLGVQHCSFAILQCMPKLSAATALRSLDLFGQGQMIGPHLNVITSSQQLTYLDVSQISGLESKHLCFLSELQSLAELRMGGNPQLDESVLPLLHPLTSLRSLDVSNSRWLGDRGLHHIAGIQGLSHLTLGLPQGTVAGILQMVSCGCGLLIRIAVDQPLSVMPGYDADVERRLRGPGGACNVYCDWGA